MPTLLTSGLGNGLIALCDSYKLAEYLNTACTIAQPEPNGKPGILAEIPPPPYIMRVLDDEGMVDWLSHEYETEFRKLLDKHQSESISSVTSDLYTAKNRVEVLEREFKMLHEQIRLRDLEIERLQNVLPPGIETHIKLRQRVIEAIADGRLDKSAIDWL